MVIRSKRAIGSAIDGAKGESYIGQIPMVNPAFEEQADLVTLLGWADEISARKNTRTDEAGNPRRGLHGVGQCRLSQRCRCAHVAFGAKGIGLCRTEHMFFEEVRLPMVQRMILANGEAERQAALDELLPFQRERLRRIVQACDRPRA